MITHVSAKTRRGKTSWVIAQCIDKLQGLDDEDYINATKYISSLNKIGIQASLPPQHHVISANIDFKCQYPNASAYEVSGYDLGMPNSYHPVKRLIPYGTYILDECQKYYMADDKSRLPPFVRRMFELHGQYFLKFYLISQRYIWVHKDVRALIDKFIYILESKHKYKTPKGKTYYSPKYLEGEEIISTTWYYKEFEDESDLEIYLKSTSKDKKSIGKNCKYTFIGDIRNYYDAYNFKSLFEKHEKDFDYNDSFDDSFTKPDTWNYKKEETNEKKGKTVSK